MKKIWLISIILAFAVLSGCVQSNSINEPSRSNLPAGTASNPANLPEITSTLPFPENTSTPAKSDLMIDRISENMTHFYDHKWYDLYQANELDCSRMSTYLWDYVRSNYHIAPKIVISYQLQHAWLALRVRDAGNSSKYLHWNFDGVDYYYLEATLPRVVADDKLIFVINDRQYTSAEFYNSTVYFFDSPQDANDFHADYTRSGGWNQEFRLLKNDLTRIEKFWNST